jgi:hypothetical protein
MLYSVQETIKHSNTNHQRSERSQMGKSLYLYGFNVLKSVNIGRTSNNLVEALGPPLLHSSGDSLQVETELIVGLCQLMS